MRESFLDILNGSLWKLTFGFTFFLFGELLHCVLRRVGGCASARAGVVHWRVVPAAAALTRTSLWIASDLRGRSAGLRRDSLHCRLTRACHEGADARLVWLADLVCWCWGGKRGRGWRLTCREGNYSKDKDDTVISPHSTLMKRAS